MLRMNREACKKGNLAGDSPGRKDDTVHDICTSLSAIQSLESPPVSTLGQVDQSVVPVRIA